MKNRVGVILAAALLCGALAAYLAFTFLRDAGNPAVAEASERGTVPVAVAARDLSVGHQLTGEDIRLVEWPSSSVPAGYSTTPAEIVGRGLITGVRTNEPLLSTKLASKEAGGGLPIAVPDGMRAMSVRVDEVIGVAGFIQPGHRVDVLVTLDQAASRSEAATQVVLQNIGVLATGQEKTTDVNGEPKVVPVVTLLVNPEQAEKLTLASTKGRIQLALRNTLDTDTTSTPGIEADELIRRQRVVSSGPVRRVVRRPSGVSVEVYRGPEKETSTVENTGDGGS